MWPTPVPRPDAPPLRCLPLATVTWRRPACGPPAAHEYRRNARASVGGRYQPSGPSAHHLMPGEYALDCLAGRTSTPACSHRATSSSCSQTITHRPFNANCTAKVRLTASLVVTAGTLYDSRL